MAFKIKVNQASLDAVERIVIDRLKQISEDKNLLNESANVLIQDIKFETRKGNSIPSQTKLKSLAKDTIKERKKLSETNTTQQTFSAKRSNLTLTGQLLDALTAIINKNTVAIRATGQRTGYKRRKRDGSIVQDNPRITNEELARFVSDDRPFIGVREKVKQRLAILARRFVRRALGRRR